MYSLLPALVSGLFLGYGAYILAAKGINRVSLCFFALCLTTFFWQATWAVLFQVYDPFWVDVLVRLGYLLIIFLPTCLYQFLVEAANQQSDRRWVNLSYGLALVLGAFNLGSDWFLAGYYDYFFGRYPKAGPLHAVHVLQTVVVVSRGLLVAWHAARGATPQQRLRLNLCVASFLIYLLAAADYLCNYGWEFYPPGVFFLLISLGLIAVAQAHVANPLKVAASVVHEIRIPLATIRMQADTLVEWIPELHKGYLMAMERGLLACPPNAPDLSRLTALASAIRKQVDRSSVVTDLLLASARQEQIQPSKFKDCSMRSCLQEALRRYPFQAHERDKVVVSDGVDFQFHGSEALMVCVLIHLLKNALQAIRVAGKGDVRLTLFRSHGVNGLSVLDTGCGIRAVDLPLIFEPYFTTRGLYGAGLGLSFCRGVVSAFHGRLDCESQEGERTVLVLRFDPVQEPPSPPPTHVTE